MTTTTTQPTNQSAPDPFGTLTALIVALLAPMFIGIRGGDIGLARRAASEAVSAYRARDHADLIAVAQIVGFGRSGRVVVSPGLSDTTGSCETTGFDASATFGAL
jgi:hypothetical protein